MKYYPYPKNLSNPESVVFLLHGWGADGRDLFPFAEIWSKSMSRTLFICVQAPDKCEGNPFGFQWFSPGDWSQDVIRKNSTTAVPALNDFINETLAQYNISSEKAAVMGFSQGMMMALAAGLQRSEKLAGVLGYSGALIHEDVAIPVNYPKPDILLFHGSADQVLPVTLHERAVAWLKGHEYPVQSQIIPDLAHGIDETGLKQGGAFLERVLGYKT